MIHDNGGHAVEISGGVDIVGAAGVAAFDERDEVRAGAQECPGAPIAGGHRDDLGPVLAGEQYRVARLTFVGGYRHAGAGAVRGDQPRDRLWPYQGLVRQRDRHGAHVWRKRGRRVPLGPSFSALRVPGAGEGLQGGAEGGAHSGAPLRVVNGVYSA